MEKNFELVPYSLETSIVENLKSKYLTVTISPDDKAAYAMVMGGLRECREIRLAVDEWHKDKKGCIIKAGKHYDKEKNRVHDLIATVEDHLKAVREAEDNRKLKIETDRVEAIRSKIAAMQALKPAQIGLTVAELTKNLNALAGNDIITAEVYQEFTEEADRVRVEVWDAITEAIEARQKFDLEEAARKTEAERLEKQRQEQEAIRVAQEAEAKRLEDIRKSEEAELKAERDALEAEKRKVQEAADRAEFERKAKLQAEADAKAKVEAEAKAKADREAKYAEKKAAKEARRPDKDKVIVFVDSILAVPVPAIRDDRIRNILDDFTKRLMDITNAIREYVEEM